LPSSKAPLGRALESVVVLAPVRRVPLEQVRPVLAQRVLPAPLELPLRAVWAWPGRLRVLPLLRVSPPPLRRVVTIARDWVGNRHRRRGRLCRPFLLSFDIIRMQGVRRRAGHGAVNGVTATSRY
jgi:hypothetical protein